MKALAIVLLILGCAACGDDGNDVTGPTTNAVPVGGRVIELFSRATVGSASIEFRSNSGSPSTATVSDGAGQYTATLPRGGEYLIFVNGRASGVAYVGGGGYLGDLLVHDGTCVARYGTITDTQGRPLAKARVSIGALQAVSAADGWYSIEFGCPSNGVIAATPVMQVSMPGYAPFSRAAGASLSGVQRFDAGLEKQD